MINKHVLGDGSGNSSITIYYCTFRRVTIIIIIVRVVRVVRTIENADKKKKWASSEYENYENSAGSIRTKNFGQFP